MKKLYHVLKYEKQGYQPPVKTTNAATFKQFLNKHGEKLVKNIKKRSVENFSEFNQQWSLRTRTSTKKEDTEEIKTKTKQWS